MAPKTNYKALWKQTKNFKAASETDSMAPPPKKQKTNASGSSQTTPSDKGKATAVPSSDEIITVDSPTRDKGKAPATTEPPTSWAIVGPTSIESVLQDKYVAFRACQTLLLQADKKAVADATFEDLGINALSHLAQSAVYSIATVIRVGYLARQNKNYHDLLSKQKEEMASLKTLIGDLEHKAEVNDQGLKARDSAIEALKKAVDDLKSSKADLESKLKEAESSAEQYKNDAVSQYGDGFDACRVAAGKKFPDLDFKDLENFVEDDDEEAPSLPEV